LHLYLRPSRVRQRYTRFAEELFKNKAVIEIEKSGFESYFIYQKKTKKTFFISMTSYLPDAALLKGPWFPLQTVRAPILVNSFNTS